VVAMAVSDPLFGVEVESQSASSRDCPGMVMLGRGCIRVGRAED
jgi:hypothetical protein